MWEPGAWPSGERCRLACLYLFEVFIFLMEAVVFGSPLISVMPILGLYIDLDELKDEATL
jgi:hypothetical protein